MHTSQTTSSPSKGITILLWVLQLGAAAMFFMSGWMKLSGNPMMVGLFQAIGLGQWFRYLTGGLEFLAACLLLLPSLAAFGALLMVPTMLGAVATHLFIVGGSPAAPVGLLVSMLLVAVLRRAQLLGVIGR